MLGKYLFRHHKTGREFIFYAPSQAIAESSFAAYADTHKLASGFLSIDTMQDPIVLHTKRKSK